MRVKSESCFGVECPPFTVVVLKYRHLLIVIAKTRNTYDIMVEKNSVIFIKDFFCFCSPIKASTVTAKVLKRFFL